MSLEALEGRAYGDRPYRLCHEKVSEFVAVTGDDPDRWTKSAPPGLAAALLFVVAPDLLADPLVDGPVVHGEQTFTWHRPLALEVDTAVTGRVDRVRPRGGVHFVNFSFAATDGKGPMVDGKSTFLVGAGSDPAEPRPLIPPHERGPSRQVGDTLPSPRSASRADLIRYAAATRDWNPIHWDHESGVAAGFGGVVVHGMLQSAWLTQVAAAASGAERPLASARFRYTAPLWPGQTAEIVQDTGRADSLSLVADGVVTVSGRIETVP